MSFRQENFRSIDSKIMTDIVLYIYIERVEGKKRQKNLSNASLRKKRDASILII